MFEANEGLDKGMKTGAEIVFIQLAREARGPEGPAR